jgi:hypothetical protein
MKLKTCFGKMLALMTVFTVFGCASALAQTVNRASVTPAGTESNTAVRETVQQNKLEEADLDVVILKPAQQTAGMDLDAAIREAARQMEARLPGGTKVALVSVASPSTAFSENVINRLESAIVGSGKLVVVDRANLDKIRSEQGFQLSGEVDDNSAKSIGKLLGAGAIVTGSLSDLGDVYSLTLKAINIETATVAVSYLADLAKTQRIATLLASGGGAGSGRTAPVQTGTARVQDQEAPAMPIGSVVYKIGDRGPSGGWIFYDKGRMLNGWRYLEAAPRESELAAQWGAYRQNVNGTFTGLGTGKQNTQKILNFMRESGELGMAAQLCNDLFIEGFEGWFLPSQGELDLMYKNLKVKGLGGFGNGDYWSSSEDGSSYAWRQRFSDGYQATSSKTYSDSVRAVRQF